MSEPDSAASVAHPCLPSLGESCGKCHRCTDPEAASDARATGVRLPEPTRCQREDEDGPCIVQAESCTCRVPFGCAEDYPGCCFCVHMDVYHPCPTFGFGCGPGCDCCTPHQQRQVFRQAQPRPLSKPEDYYEPDPFADDDEQSKTRLVEGEQP